MTHGEERLCPVRIVGKEEGWAGLGMGILAPVLNLTVQVPLS